MILCIDSGNTRIKWGLCEGERWLSLEAAPHAEFDVFVRAMGRLPFPERIMVANVAGEAAAEAIRGALSAWAGRIEFARSETARCGVTNGYIQPGRLGVDRWCALLGARRQTNSACLVVGAGTATTIDTLDEDGHFRGGLILPGFELMRRSLFGNTADLPLAEGQHETFPRRTDDAIHSGCLEAQLGAVERAWTRIAGRPGAECLLFGGAAGRLQEHLALPCRRVDTLVLDGLAALAAENSH